MQRPYQINVSFINASDHIDIFGRRNCNLLTKSSNKIVKKSNKKRVKFSDKNFYYE